MGQQALFGIYVHWPFCLSKCPYCDFNSHVRRDINHESWRRAFEREIEYYAALTGGRRVTSVFFGGGTPSLMEPETVHAVLESIDGHWAVEPDCEVTLEANPTSVESSKFRAFKDAGVNRVSIGVQSLDNEVLRFLGRTHTAQEALDAVQTAAHVFERYSFDLIYARPGQTPEMWTDELSGALAYAGEHLSLYQLTIEPGTAFYTQAARGEFTMPDDDTAGEIYELTQDMMTQAGRPAYEVSNHARPGCESRHNLAYWRYDDYLGIGPGAHGRLTLEGEKHAIRAHSAPEIWMQRTMDQGYGAHPFEKLDEGQCVSEALMMGLRLCEGIPWDRLDPLLVREWRDKGRLEVLQQEGYIVFDQDALKPTPAGRQRLNSVISYLMQ